jgi:hypothetical protein
MASRLWLVVKDGGSWGDPRRDGYGVFIVRADSYEGVKLILDPRGTQQEWQWELVDIYPLDELEEVEPGIIYRHKCDIKKREGY